MDHTLFHKWLIKLIINRGKEPQFGSKKKWQMARRSGSEDG
jgi:hypothetical protein